MTPQERKYVATFKEVAGVIDRVWPLKGKQQYYTYSFKPDVPEASLMAYLHKTYKNINISSSDKEPTVAEKQKITIMELGVEIRDGYVNGYIIQGDSGGKIESTSEEPPTFNPEEMEKGLSDTAEIGQKKDTVRFIVQQSREISTPEGQQAFMNPAFRFFEK